MKHTKMQLITTFALMLMSAPALAEPFELEPLPYASDALEPVIDQLTMNIHHGRHHRGYVNKLNAQVENHPELNELTIKQVMSRVSEFGEAVRNSGGGHYNHSLFWRVMAPAEKSGEPSGALLDAIQRDFGSLSAFQERFAEAAATRFGSGWAWLIVDGDGKLSVTSTPNQDNPLMDVVDVRGTPILGLDVWEHAYYLSYQNRRGAYLNHWWEVVNWEEVSQLFEQANDASTTNG